MISGLIENIRETKEVGFVAYRFVDKEFEFFAAIDDYTNYTGNMAIDNKFFCSVYYQPIQKKWHKPWYPSRALDGCLMRCSKGYAGREKWVSENFINKWVIKCKKDSWFEIGCFKQVDFNTNNFQEAKTFILKEYQNRINTLLSDNIAFT